MDDKKQIEEMAYDIKASLAHHIQKTILYPYITRDLYKLGYRKIPEGAVVLTKEEYERFKNLEKYHITCEDVSEYISTARKETARKIIEKLQYNNIDDNDVIVFWEVKDILKEIAKQYGVEVE